jgi:hypothetical protein
MCDGSVHIRADEVDCNLKTAKIFAKFNGGMNYEAGDEVGISFWNQSLCVDSAIDYDSLWSYCSGDFLGRYVFKTMVQGC